MKKIKYILYLSLATILLSGCSQTLEETYDNVTDGSKIRYVAKCSDLEIQPGWERLIVEWKNGTDATIHKINLIWTYDGKKDSTLLEPLTTKFELNNLDNTVYKFEIFALDKNGNKSLSTINYGRPYTREHEVMNAFSRGILKSYFLKDKMIFFSDRWNENISQMRLEYKDTKGNTKYFDLTEDTANQLIVIDDFSMNPEHIPYILRKGKFEDSVDEIIFDPYPISRKKNYSSGFLNEIERRYGYSMDTKESEILFEEFINEVKELEFDYDIETFEDILYCPNLEKLIFGKNRYTSKYFEAQLYRSLITGNQDKSRLIVEKAIEVLGVKIESYGGTGSSDSHYFKPKINGTISKGVSVLPNLEVIGNKAFKEYEDGNLISCTPSDPYAELNQLLDDDNETRWETTSTRKMRVYEMYMELKEETELGGVKIAQPLYVPRQDKRTPFFMPNAIKIQTSIDGASWDNVTYFETNILGLSSGEITLLKFPEGKRAVKHIKINLQEKADANSNWMINLGDIVLFR